MKGVPKIEQVFFGLVCFGFGFGVMITFFCCICVFSSPSIWVFLSVLFLNLPSVSFFCIFLLYISFSGDFSMSFSFLFRVSFLSRALQFQSFQFSFHVSFYLFPLCLFLLCLFFCCVFRLEKEKGEEREKSCKSWGQTRGIYTPPPPFSRGFDPTHPHVCEPPPTPAVSQQILFPTQTALCNFISLVTLATLLVQK